MRPTLQALKSRSRDQRGVVAIEFVIVFPFLLLILFALVVMGGYFSLKTRTVGAARDGARYYALLQTGTFTPPAGITVTRTSAACPPRTDPNFNTVNVTVRAQSTFTQTSIIGMGTQTITETATMRCGG
jgi:Flp pilus assembly protein TadG